MDDSQILMIMQKIMLLILEVSAPILIVAIVVGLIISVFQTITQIQESTLTFVPKMIAALVTIIVLLPWMFNLFITRTNEIFSYIVVFAQN